MPTVLEYFIGEEEVYVFAISDQEIGVHSIDDHEFSQRTGRFLDALQRGVSQRFSGASDGYWLYNHLISPFSDRLGEKLVIVPDGILYLIPFGVLPTSPSGKDYLVEHHQITAAYSGSLLKVSFAHKNADYERSLAFAPFSDLEGEGVETRGFYFGALPNSSDEVSSLGNLFKGSLGTKGNFLDQVANKSIIHLATHAAIDTSNGAQFIIFHPGEEESDYKLFLHELAQLDLGSAQLMIVNACKAGWGEITPSEGVISLGRGLSMAGATSVLMSIWDANDQATAEVMSSFHKYHKRGDTQAEALQKAQIDFLKSAGQAGIAPSAFPQLWGNFSLFGDLEIQRPSLLPSTPAILITSLVIGLLLIAVLRYASKSATSSRL